MEEEEEEEEGYYQETEEEMDINDLKGCKTDLLHGGLGPGLDGLRNGSEAGKASIIYR